MSRSGRIFCFSILALVMLLGFGSLVETPDEAMPVPMPEAAESGFLLSGEAIPPAEASETERLLVLRRALLPMEMTETEEPEVPLSGSAGIPLTGSRSYARTVYTLPPPDDLPA